MFGHAPRNGKRAEARRPQDQIVRHTQKSPALLRTRGFMIGILIAGLTLSGCIGGEDLPLDPGNLDETADEPPMDVSLGVASTEEGVEITWRVEDVSDPLERLVILAAKNPIARSSEVPPYEQWIIENPSLTGARKLPLPTGLWYLVARAEDGTGKVAWSQDHTITVSEPALGDQGQPRPLSVDAGPPLQITDSSGTGEASFNLQGTANPGPEHTILRYEWYEDSVKVRNTFMSTFTRPIGVHAFTFQVTYEDGSGIQKTAQDELQVRILPNQAPRADAGEDLESRVLDGSGRADVVLDGSASTDPDGNIESFVWQRDGATIISEEKDTARFSVGTHTITLTVRDNGGAESTDTKTVTVHPKEQPVAQAQADSTEMIDLDDSGDETVTLDGTKSFHPGGTITSYNWINSTGAVVATQAKPSLDMSVGIHEFTLTVEDQAGDADTDSVTVTVLPQPDPPVAVFTHECEALTCTFDATGSTGYDATFTWEFSDGAEATGPVVTHTFPDFTRYTITLNVEDSIDRTDTAELDVNLRADLPLRISSSAFGPDDEIPGRYGCQLAFNSYPFAHFGVNPLPQFGISPPIALTAPQDAESLVVTILDRVDRGNGPSNFPHWILYDIPIPPNGIVEIPEMGPPPGVEGMNVFEEIGYLEFCGVPEFSPTVHPFEFRVFALDTTLDMDEGATWPEVMTALDGHILATDSFEAVYSNKICLAGISPDTCVLTPGILQE